MMANMRLRLACVDDIPSIAEMERRPQYRTFVGNWSEEEHRTRMAGPDCRCFVAESEPGRLAGFAILRGLASPHRSFGCRESS
jgi:hypothetical protein